MTSIDFNDFSWDDRVKQIKNKSTESTFSEREDICQLKKQLEQWIKESRDIQMGLDEKQITSQHNAMMMLRLNYVQTNLHSCLQALEVKLKMSLDTKQKNSDAMISEIKSSPDLPRFKK